MKRELLTYISGLLYGVIIGISLERNDSSFFYAMLLFTIALAVIIILLTRSGKKNDSEARLPEKG